MPPPPPPKNPWKRQKLHLMIKLPSNDSLLPTLFKMFPQRLIPDPLSFQSPTYHIHWEIAIFIPPPPPPKNPRKIQKLQWTMKLLSTNPMHPSLHPLPPTMLTPDSLARQYPTTHIHLETVISISKSPPTPTPPGKKTWKLMIKLLSSTPLPPMLFPIFLQRLPHNTLARQYPTHHINW